MNIEESSSEHAGQAYSLFRPQINDENETQKSSLLIIKRILMQSHLSIHNNKVILHKIP